MSVQNIPQGANQVASGDLLRLFAAIKDNVMRSLAVARVAVVEKVETVYAGKTKRYTCRDATDKEVTICAYAMEMVTLDGDGKAARYIPAAGDMVAILFTDSDFRPSYNNTVSNYSGFAQNSLNTGDRHSTSYGIIIGKMK